MQAPTPHKVNQFVLSAQQVLTAQLKLMNQLNAWEAFTQRLVQALVLHAQRDPLAKSELLNLFLALQAATVQQRQRHVPSVLKEATALLSQQHRFSAQTEHIPLLGQVDAQNAQLEATVSKDQSHQSYVTLVVFQRQLNLNANRVPQAIIVYRAHQYLHRALRVATVRLANLNALIAQQAIFA